MNEGNCADSIHGHSEGVALCSALLRHDGFSIDIEANVRSIAVDEDLGK